jgi:hypothetical protein
MGHGTKIDPALKSWLDNVLVPAMVRLYLDSRSDVRDNCPSPSPHADGDTEPSERVQ